MDARDSRGPSSTRSRGLFRQALGLGCLLAWTDITFFSRLVHFSTRNSISHLNSTYTFACCGIIAALVLCALPWNRILPALGIETPAALRLDSPKGLLRSRRVVVFAAGLLTVCTVTLLLVERRFFTQPWCSIASTIAGMAIGVLYLGWASALTDPHEDGRNLVLRIALAFCAGAALFVATLNLPDAGGILVVCALPAATAACLLAGRPFAGDPAYPEPESAPEHQHAPRAMPRVLQRALVSFALLGFAESLSRALFLEVDPLTDGGVAYRWLFLVSTVASALIIVFANTFGERSSTARTLNRVCLFAFVSLTVLAPLVHGGGLWGDLPAMVCFCLLYLFVWTSLAQTARAYRVDATRLFGFGLGATYAGCLAGTFLGSVLASYFAMGWRAECTIAFACTVVVLVALLFVADDRTLTALIDADGERPRGPRRFRLRIEEVAATYGLTAKETEVLTLAAKGRTTQRIREELGISTGTVNTHLMHIYKKLDVHDRQQMLDMLDGREEDA